MYVCGGGNTALPGVKKRNESSVGFFFDTCVYIQYCNQRNCRCASCRAKMQAGYVAFNHKLNPG